MQKKPSRIATKSTPIAVSEHRGGYWLVHEEYCSMPKRISRAEMTPYSKNIKPISRYQVTLV